MSTSDEPAYAEDGRPGLRYRLYHEEKAKGGIALTMIGGSAVVAPDSPPAFGNLQLFDGRIMDDLQTLARAVHAHGAAVMVPDHSPRPPHLLEPGRLAAGAGTLAGARASPPLVSQGDGGA